MFTFVVCTVAELDGCGQTTCFFMQVVGSQAWIIWLLLIQINLITGDVEFNQIIYTSMCVQPHNRWLMWRLWLVGFKGSANDRRMTSRRQQRQVWFLRVMCRYDGPSLGEMKGVKGCMWSNVESRRHVKCLAGENEVETSGVKERLHERYR